MKSDFSERSVPSPQEMRVLISRYRISGLGLKRFAREHGISPTRLHYWVYQKSRGKARKACRAVRSPMFQEVKMAAGRPAMPSWAAEISLPTGVAIRFSAAAMPAWIVSVVQALQGPC